MAGPWFAVHRSGDDWQRLDQVWVSNGKEDCRGQIEVRITLDEQEDGSEISSLFP